MTATLKTAKRQEIHWKSAHMQRSVLELVNLASLGGKDKQKTKVSGSWGKSIIRKEPRNPLLVYSVLPSYETPHWFILEAKVVNNV